MKKLLSLVLILILVVCVVPLSGIKTLAASSTLTIECGEDIVCIIDTFSKTATFMGNGKISAAYSWKINNYIDEYYEARDIVEKIILKDGITEVYYGAFATFTNAKEIHIPATVNNIMSNAFEHPNYVNVGMNELTYIYVSSENPYYLSNDGVLFNKDQTELIRFPSKRATEYVVPEGVEKICAKAFENSYDLVSIILPSSLTIIDFDAFANCQSLAQINIPENVTHLYSGAFSSCYNLKNVYFPKELQQISIDAFYNCRSLVKVELPKNVSLLMPIGGLVNSNPFGGCTSLKNILIDDDSENYISIDGVLYSKDKTELVAFPAGRSGVANVLEGTEKICNKAFYGAKLLTNIVLPDTLKEIDSFAFASCYSLQSIILPQSITELKYQTFSGLYSLKEITILNSECTITERFLENSDLIIKGHKGSTAEEYAHEYDFIFVNINKADDYYKSVGSYGIVAKDIKGLGITNYTISFNGESIVADNMLTYVNIPDDYNGKIIVSKEGYISVVRSADDLEKYNFFVLYPDSYANPIIQQFKLYNKTYGGAYTDLLNGYHEYIYDLEAINYDIYLDVNYNGNDISTIYLQQGKNKISLVNGKNKNILLNGSFNSDGGTIYLCMLKTDGTIYKVDSKIVALTTRQKLEFNQTGNMSTEIDESIDGVGGFGVDVKLPVPNLPISIKINSDGTFKGTVGVKSKNYNATYYEQISETIKKISSKTAGSDSVDSYSTLEMAKLEKYIEEGGGDLISSGANVGIDVDMKFVGCIEGKLSEKGGLETCDISLIASISGSVSYTQQSAVMVAIVPVPYYWTVAAEAELAATLKIALKEGNDDVYFDLPTVNLPEITAKVSLSGELCAGVNKIIGGGTRLTGAITLQLPGMGKDIDETVITLNVDFEVVGQIAGFEGSWTPFGDHIIDYQIYPTKNDKSLQLALNTKPLAREYLKSASTLNLEARNNSPFKTNTYTYTNPQVAQLSDGNLIMVWMDDVIERNDINRTALFYSIYNHWYGQWSEPQIISDDGTADFSPVLKKLGDEIYLVWNNANTQFDNDASYEDVIKSTEICISKFDGANFGNVTFITNNQYMDVVSSLNCLDGKPTITWVTNTQNDIAGQFGNNSIYISELIDGEWKNKLIANELQSVNSAVAVYENHKTVVYYSMDTDNSFLTTNDIEIFKCSNGIIEQITNNSVNDTYLVSTDSKVFWNCGGSITDGQSVYKCDGLYSDFQILFDGENYIAVYSTFDNSEFSSIYTVNCSNSTESVAFESECFYGTIGDFSAVYDFETNEIILVTNQIYDDVADLVLSSIYQYPLYITNAYYDELTLISGGELSAYIDISNDSFKTYNGYTIYAYANQEMLLKSEFSGTINSGENVTHNLLISLPSNIDFDMIDFYIVPNGDYLNLDDISGVLFLNLYDISLEHPLIVSEVDQDKLQISVVNRGMKKIENVKVELRKDSIDGEIIKEVEIKSILPNNEEIISFIFDGLISMDDVYYVTTSEIEFENKVSNNSAFAVKVQTIQNEIIIENIIDDYIQLKLETPYRVSDTLENVFVFIPSNDGLYAFESFDNSIDICGYIFDSDMNELAFDNDEGEEDNFQVKYTLTAGQTYFLKAKPQSYASSGSYSIRVINITSSICNHTYEWIIDKQETCGTTGVKHEKCSICDTIRNSDTIISETGNHTYDNNLDATCNICGNVREVSANGWQLQDNVWYYCENGVIAVGWKYIGGTWYYFNQNGAMQTGWVYDGVWYYLADNGAMVTGWQNLGGTWYYFNQSGAMQTGWLLDGVWYYLADNGVMVDGWQYIGSSWYYFSGGAMQTGWLNQGGTWYYLADSGNMVTGWQYIGSNWYYFHDGGNMATGWLLLGNTWYYLASGGNMLTDWQLIGGTWYYFNSSGAWVG